MHTNYIDAEIGTTYYFEQEKAKCSQTLQARHAMNKRDPAQNKNTMFRTKENLTSHFLLSVSKYIIGIAKWLNHSLKNVSYNYLDMPRLWTSNEKDYH